MTPERPGFRFRTIRGTLAVSEFGDDIMSNDSFVTLPELERRLAIVRDNIRQLIEQAAANSGAGDESRNADRLAQQQAELDRLTKERDKLLKK
jgi:hypothetical protein